jgi:ComF family protein
LSRKKERQRGYNQSDWIAWGISEATGIPTDTTSVVRTKSNPSQTTLDHRQRRENVRDIFAVRHPESLEGRHILLVDDVITTGATMLSCAETIARACRVRFSVLSLAWAGHS